MVLDSGLGTLQRDFVTFTVTAAWVTLRRVDPPYRQLDYPCIVLNYSHWTAVFCSFIYLFCCFALDSGSHILFQIGLKVLRMTL